MSGHIQGFAESFFGGGDSSLRKRELSCLLNLINNSGTAEFLAFFKEA